MADTVWVVRHGQRQDTVDPDWADHADRLHDPPLTELGRWAAWRVGRRFADSDVHVDAVYTSPFLRAVETTQEICDETGWTAQLEPGIGEHRNADWFDGPPETLSPGTIRDRFDAVGTDHEPVVVPEFPETHEAAVDRIGRAVDGLLASTDGSLLLVGHGITVGAVVAHLLGTGESADAPLCGLTRLDREGNGWVLDFSGDTAHLDD